MNALYRAVMVHFGLTPGSGFYNDIGGRLYLNHAPQESTFPYCVFFLVADDTDPDFTDEHEEITLQFNIFSQNNSALEAGTLLESLKTMFDYCHLTVTGWSHLDFRRMSVSTNNDFAQVPPVHGYSVTYDVLLEKKR